MRSFILILIGFRCAGKTTLGRRLAEKLHCPFIDTDEKIVEKYKELVDPEHEAVNI